MSKTFASAGVSKTGGKFSLRCTNREAATYADILTKEGHEAVNIIKLKEPKTKEEARKYLSGLKAFQDPAILACLKGDDAPKAPAKPAKDKPASSKASSKPKTTTAKGGSKGKGKTKEAGGDAGSNNPDVPTAESDHDAAVDAAAELGMTEPAFMKHTQAE